MIIPIFYKTRDDGVNLIKRLSGEYAADGITVIPSGYMIHKIGTEEYYAEAIDVENAPWSYEETDIPVDEEEMPEDRDGISDAEFRQLVEEAL